MAGMIVIAIGVIATFWLMIWIGVTVAARIHAARTPIENVCGRYL